MESQRLVFPNLVEGLVRATGNAVTPSLKAALRQQGLDLDKKFPPAWEVSNVGAWLDLFAEAKSPGAARDEALRLLGRAFIDGWRGTLVGGAMSVVLRTVGPERSLSRLQRAFRTGDNFTIVTVTPLDTPPPWKLARVHFNESWQRPSYFLGVLEAGSVLVGARHPEITAEPSRGNDVSFLLRYQP